jgi:methyl-accepting chemotaxis protein
VSDEKTAPQQLPEWYAQLPSWSRVFMQLGFAAVVAILFVLDSRERSAQIRESQADIRNIQTENRLSAKEERLIFREELRLNREDLKAVASQMTAVASEMRRAVDSLGEGQRKLKSDVDDIKYPFPKPRESTPKSEDK